VTDEQLKEVVLRHLTRIAPEVDPDALEPDTPFRDQYDLDSMDFLNFVIGVCEELEVDISEKDYARLGSLEEAVSYLGSRGAAR
jgi:acyl carrier protein